MPALSPKQFVAKWGKIQQKETAVSQSHFNDVCALIGHKPPLEHDPEGKNFSFETQTEKPDGAKGFADVYFRDHFIWEYKGPHANLTKAYQQLQLYREDLQNPPLLITSDIHTIIIHTNFNNYPTQKHTITFDDILSGDGVQKLRWAFFDPEKFKPEKTQQDITKASADTFVAVAEAMKQHQKVTGETYTAEQLAHFMSRLLFCLFAEDLGLLPVHIFTQIIKTQSHAESDLRGALQSLFGQMRDGGNLIYRIRHFNGTLFDDEFVPTIPADLAQALLRAAVQDWSAVDPSIFGTLFERVIDDSKRAQLGAHYTSESDIMLIVEPVLMSPLKQKWETTRRHADRLLRTGDATAAHTLLANFAAEIAAVRVLDPACGSGNFLYVALRELLNLQKAVISWAARREVPLIELTVNPEQLYGIELNAYAHELAQITAWIGYLQWRNENGFAEMADPILRPLHNIQRMDAILAYDADGNPVEPEWPAADVIIGNPPFLGAHRLRRELGDDISSNIRNVYSQLPGGCDLVCYWFEKARNQLLRFPELRVGFIATQAIRGGSNRVVLERILEIGNIFRAWSDRLWILDGAAVQVSIVAFDSGLENHYTLNGKSVEKINSNLTSSVDLTVAQRLTENTNLSFKGDAKVGPFDISDAIAKNLISRSRENKKELNNLNVIRPWVNGLDVTQRPRSMWIIDFGVNSTAENAAQYKAPFAYLEQHVKPFRAKAKSAKGISWWLHQRPRPEMRSIISGLQRFIATPVVAKHRVFAWLKHPTIPDQQVIVLAREDDSFFGILHSRIHELWVRNISTQLRDAESATRYIPTVTFETFPFPWPPSQEPPATHPLIAEIAHWAKTLVQWRDAWQNPPPPQQGVIDVAFEKMLKKRTLTNLYNGLVYYRQTSQQRPQGSSRPLGSGQPQLWDQAQFDKVTRKSVSRAAIQDLDDIHTALDTAVFDAYGWPHHLTDEQILENLLALNLERAAAQ